MKLKPSSPDEALETLKKHPAITRNNKNLASAVMVDEAGFSYVVQYPAAAASIGVEFLDALVDEGRTDYFVLRMLNKLQQAGDDPAAKRRAMTEIYLECSVNGAAALYLAQKDIDRVDKVIERRNGGKMGIFTLD